MVVLVLVVAAALLTALFIRHDARKRGRNSLFWFIFTLSLFGLCAIPVYIYSIRKKRRRVGRELS